MCDLGFSLPGKHTRPRLPSLCGRFPDPVSWRAFGVQSDLWAEGRSAKEELFILQDQFFGFSYEF